MASHRLLPINSILSRCNESSSSQVLSPPTFLNATQPAMGPGKRAALDKNNKLDAILDEIEYLKASFRAKGSLSRL
jgi:hypothetical protein